MSLIGKYRFNAAFDDATVEAVWRRGRPVAGYDPAKYRVDVCNAWIERSKYGDTTPGGRGWEIDHISPVSKGGQDDLRNLQPLQWENNRSKGDSEGGWRCAVGA